MQGDSQKKPESPRCDSVRAEKRQASKEGPLLPSSLPACLTAQPWSQTPAAFPCTVNRLTQARIIFGTIGMLCLNLSSRPEAPRQLEISASEGEPRQASQEAGEEVINQAWLRLRNQSCSVVWNQTRSRHIGVYLVPQNKPNDALATS